MAAADFAALASRCACRRSPHLEHQFALEVTRRANPGVEIVTRGHYDAEVEHLAKLGANRVIMDERKIARAMIEEVRADGTTVNAL